MNFLSVCVRQDTGPLIRKAPLTDADGDEHDAEGVEDGDERLGEGQDDLLHRLDPPKEAARRMRVIMQK